MKENPFGRPRHRRNDNSKMGLSIGTSGAAFWKQ